MSVPTVKDIASLFAPLVLVVIAALLFTGCAINYDTPYNFDIDCRMSE